MPEKKILIVEDEGLIAMDLENKVGAMGFELAGVALSGEEALEMTEAVSPDLVLMDITLKKGMDGIEAALRLKERFGMPVVFITGNTDEMTKKRAMATRPAAYIEKPINAETIREAIRSALG